MKQQNYETGKLGERIASKYLQDKGFNILENNFSTKIGELDLIGIDKDTLVFIEVKLKIGDEFGSPEEMIDKKKLAQVEKASQMYLLKNSQISSIYQNYRIDAVAIVLDSSKQIVRINHYENLTG